MKTKIYVNSNNELGNISRELYGINHRYSYNNSLGSGMWDKNEKKSYRGFDGLYDDIGFTSLRYPGGTVANLFRWKDAIGNISKRKKSIHGSRKDFSPQPVDFGLDEALTFCEEHNTTLVYMYGIGHGLNTPEDAADLVAYLNKPNDGTNPKGGTDWAAVRASHGHEEPYGIKYFEIGNEMYFEGQRYWLAGKSEHSYQYNYAFGGTVTFENQSVSLSDDWRNSASYSDGSPNQIKYSKSAPIDENTESVYVDGIQWESVHNFDNVKKENVYTIDHMTGTITFGDGENGNIPQKGAQITMSYKSTRKGFVDYYKAMKAVDPNIRIYSCLEDEAFMDIMGSQHRYDGIALHPYTWKVDYDDEIEFHNKAIFCADEAAKKTEKIWQMMLEKTSDLYKDSMDVIVTEYGFEHNNAPFKDYKRGIGHALYLARLLVHFISLGVKSAQKHTLISYNNTKETHSDSSAVVGGGEGDFFMTPQGLVFKMFIKHFGTMSIQAEMSQSPLVKISEGTQYPALMVAASKDKKGNIYIMVINSDRKKDISTQIILDHLEHETYALCHRLSTLYDVMDTRGIDSTAIECEKMRVDSNCVDFTFAPCSITSIKIIMSGSE